MKIIAIAIVLEPNEDEKARGMEKTALSRNEEKLWSTNRIDGMYPYEVKLAGMLQDIISKFNGGQ